MEQKKETTPSQNPDPAAPNTSATGEKNIDKWCFAYFAGSEEHTRAALLNSSKWPDGSNITISFLDGDPEVQRRVEEAALEWVQPGLANLTFVFLNDSTGTDIRISFRYAGSWSVLGNTCQKVEKGKPTMNFGWLDRTTPDAELRRVVLHEFGHALGLIHEHMTPADGGIQWNKKRVTKDLSGPPNNWTEDVIYNNMFRTFDEDELALTRLDKESIMMYPIPAKWTLDGFSVGLNTELSQTDRDFIRQMYP